MGCAPIAPSHYAIPSPSKPSRAWHRLGPHLLHLHKDYGHIQMISLCWRSQRIGYLFAHGDLALLG